MASSRPPPPSAVFSSAAPGKGCPASLSVCVQQVHRKAVRGGVHRAFLRHPACGTSLITSPKAGLVGSGWCLSIRLHEPSHHPQWGRLCSPRLRERQPSQRTPRNSIPHRVRHPSATGPKCRPPGSGRTTRTIHSGSAVPVAGVVGARGRGESRFQRDRGRPPTPSPAPPHHS